MAREATDMAPRGNLFIAKPLTPGARFGGLTVIEAAAPASLDRSSTKLDSRSLLQCDCGNTIIAFNKLVRRGDVTSCGCRSHINASRRKTLLPGLRFGMLTVVEPVPPANGKSRSLVECDCGNRKILDNVVLKSGRVASCGCRRQTHVDDAEWNRLFAYYRHLCAGKRGYEWNLTVNQFKRLAQMPCAYCGVVGCNTLKSARKSIGAEGDLKYNGLDRVDCTTGYFLGNVVTCCDMCNYAKNDYPLDEFIGYLRVLGSSLTADQVRDCTERLRSELM